MNAEARLYEVRMRDVTVDRFRTAATVEASGDEQALDRLGEYHRLHPGGAPVLWFLDGPHECPLAEASYGRVLILVDMDDLAADACHCGPRIVPVDMQPVYATLAAAS